MPKLCLCLKPTRLWFTMYKQQRLFRPSLFSMCNNEWSWTLQSGCMYVNHPHIITITKQNDKSLTNFVACGQPCTVTTDCMQSGSNCTQCLSGLCYATCGLQCGNDSECEPSSDCTYCDFGSSMTGLCQYPQKLRRRN